MFRFYEAAVCNLRRSAASGHTKGVPKAVIALALTAGILELLY